MIYELQLEKFQGPLDKLLELIEEKKLPVSDISLAAVTDDFLKHIESLKKVEFALLADFISIASRLILIKSKSLLPELQLSDEEESDIKDLEKRLLVYRELRGAKKHIQSLWTDPRKEYSREYLLNTSSPTFSPGTNISSDILATSLARIFTTVQKLVHETETIKEKIISLEEKIKEVLERMTNLTHTTFSSLRSGTKSEIIATFLAILHLAREQLVNIEQTSHFSDIVIKKN